MLGPSFPTSIPLSNSLPIAKVPMTAPPSLPLRSTNHFTSMLVPISSPEQGLFLLHPVSDPLPQESLASQPCHDPSMTFPMEKARWQES